MALSNSLMNVPVLREMLGLEQFDEQQRASKVLSATRMIEAARRLAELQNLPVESRLRAAQADRAEYELGRDREADKIMSEAAGRHLRPQVTPIQGPTMPGEAPLGATSKPPGPSQYDAYLSELMGNPKTQASAVALEKALRGDWMPIGAGGAINTRTRETVAGGGFDPVSKAYQDLYAAETVGDEAKAESLRKRIQHLESGRSMNKLSAATRATELARESRSRSLTEVEADELETLWGYLATPTQVQTSQGVFMQPGMNLPRVAEAVERVRGGRGPTAPGTPQPSGRPGEFGLQPVPAQPSGQMAPTPEVQKEVAGRSLTRKMLESLERDFDDKYALGPFNRGLNAVTGGLPAMIRYAASRAKLGGQDADYADWWSGLLELVAGKRHALVGATLTENERKMFEELIAARGDSPDRIRSILSRLAGEAKEQERSVTGTLKQKYSPAAIDEAVGKDNPYVFGKRAIEAARAKAKGGGTSSKVTEEHLEDITAPDGWKGRTRVRTLENGREEYYRDGKWQEIR